MTENKNPPTELRYEGGRIDRIIKFQTPNGCGYRFCLENDCFVDKDEDFVRGLLMGASLETVEKFADLTEIQLAEKPPGTSGEWPTTGSVRPNIRAFMHCIFNEKFPVLDKGFVQILDIMGDDMAIVEAARTSTSTAVGQREKNRKLLRYLYENKHTSPFEQVEFKFLVKAPVVVWWQWSRHRTWSYNAQSGRYAPLEDEFHIPERWRGQAEKNKQGSVEGAFSTEENDDLAKSFFDFSKYAYDLYEKALKAGVAREQARLFLPGFAVYYTWVCKVDAHNLMHFLRLRMAEDAQWEIREYARTIYEEIFKKALPWTAELFEESLNADK